MHPRACQTQEPPATVLFNPRFVAQQPGNNPPPIRGHVRDPPPPPPPPSLQWRDGKRGKNCGADRKERV